MADILIRGMEMPKSCDVCPFVGTNDDLMSDDYRYLYCGFPYMGQYVTDYEASRHPDCPIGSLPKGHGRLIDADALDRAFTDLRFNSDGTLNHWGDRPGWCMHGYEVEKLIADAPTIVPAEGGTE